MSSSPQVDSPVAQDGPTAPDAARPGSARCVAVLVHYRCPDDLSRSVRALRRTSPEVGIVIVENDAGSESASRARELLAGVAGLHVLDAPSNLGFGAGCNLGIDHALAEDESIEHVLLLNPDTEIQSGCLARLRETARQHPRAAIVGGCVRDGRGDVWFENGRIDGWTLSRCHVAAPGHDRVQYPTQFITGAMMLLNASALREGLRFDEKYFLYAEDLDLCRAAEASGWELWIRRDAEVVHHAGGSQRDDPAVLGELRAGQLEHMTRGKVRFARKWLPWYQRLVFYGVAFLVKPLVGLIRTRSTRFVAPYFRGLAGGRRGG